MNPNDPLSTLEGARKWAESMSAIKALSDKDLARRLKEEVWIWMDLRGDGASLVEEAIERLERRD